MKKEAIKSNNTYLDNELFKNNQWCGCKHSKTFHYENTRQKLFITNLLSLDRDK